MKTIKQNKAALKELLQEVQEHCMCALFEDNGAKFLVTYPPGMILGGVQATHAGCGKIVALERMLNAMERHWIDSGIHGGQNHAITE